MTTLIERTCPCCNGTGTQLVTPERVQQEREEAVAEERAELARRFWVARMISRHPELDPENGDERFWRTGGRYTPRHLQTHLKLKPWGA